MKADEPSMVRAKRLLATWGSAGLAGGLAFVVYWQTLLPGVGWGDTARFQYVARIWGIPHRFGYPLYVALSRLFGALPLGSLAFRINLMSAVFAALAVVMVWAIVLRLARDPLAAVVAGLAFAFSRALWGQAVVAEVYALNAFLVGAVLLVLLTWHQTRKPGWLFLGIGLYALSFGNHMTVVTLVPAVVYLVVATDARLLLQPKKVLPLAGMVVLGAAQYLYVILRAQQQPLLNELGPFSWGGWLHWMVRNRFPGQFFGFTLGDQVDRLRIYLELLERQFYRWGYILGFVGAWELLRSEPAHGPAEAGGWPAGERAPLLPGASLQAFVFLALAALGIYVFGMNYGGITFRIYLIPSYLVFAVFIGCALGALRRRLARLAERWPRGLALALQGGFAVALVVIPLYPLRQNWVLVDESDNTYYQEMAWNFVEHAAPDFVLVDSEPHYDDLEAILYVAWAEKEWYNARWILHDDIDAWLGQRPVYAWSDGTDYHRDYVEEALPGVPGMVRIVGRQDSQ